MLSETLVQRYKLVEEMKPATDAAGRTGQYVGLKHGKKVTFVFDIDQGNAATIALSILQATSAAGAGSKAISGGTFKIWSNLDCSATDTLVAQTDAATYTTDAAVKRKMVVIEVDASQLDIANGFAYVAAVTGASNVANLTQCTAVVMGERFPQATPPSAIV